MLITNRTNTRFGKYEGFSTHLLIGEFNSGSKDISIQITDVDPNEQQFLHSHEQSQCYYILTGTGWMTIDDQTEKVKKGDAERIVRNAINHPIYFLLVINLFFYQRFLFPACPFRTPGRWIICFLFFIFRQIHKPSSCPSTQPRSCGGVRGILWGSWGRPAVS